MSKHFPQTQRVTDAAYRVEDKLRSLAAVARRGAWGSPEPCASLPTVQDPHRLPLPEVTRRQAELDLALAHAAGLLEDVLTHLEDTAEQQDLAIAAAY